MKEVGVENSLRFADEENLDCAPGGGLPPSYVPDSTLVFDTSSTARAVFADHVAANSSGTWYPKLECRRSNSLSHPRGSLQFGVRPHSKWFRGRGRHRAEIRIVYYREGSDLLAGFYYRLLYLTHTRRSY